MPPEVQPPELAQLIDFAERPRVQDWSLRSALVRYAQPQPERVQEVLELVRRIEWALHPHMKVIEREGPGLWDEFRAARGAATASASGPRAAHEFVVALLRPIAVLDELGDELAAWAVDITQDRPDSAVDTATARVAQDLAELGVPREERPDRGPAGRGPRSGARQV